MKKLEELNKSKTPIATYDKRLDKYENMPLFQKKLDKANAILAKSNPLVFLRELENKQIKQYFEQNMPIEQISHQLRLTQEEVLLRLHEMSLIEANTCV
jgi:folate-dependent tRNA-U54 methylase TrmFO/GidA